MASPPPPNSKKRVFPESSCMDQDVVVLSGPPPSWTQSKRSRKGKKVLTQSKRSRKAKKVIFPDVIEIDDDEDCDTPMFTDVRVDGSIKGKTIQYSSNVYPDKGAVTTNVVGSSGLQIFFDNADIPFCDIRNINSVSGSSSVYTKYQAAKGVASTSQNIIDLDGPSSDAYSFNGVYSDRYLDKLVDKDAAFEAPLPNMFTFLDPVNKNVKSSMDTDEAMTKFKVFKQFDTAEDHSDHHYTKTSKLTTQKNWGKKIQEEWRILEKDLPDTIFVRIYETRMDLLRAVIVGAEGTPYHDGLFFFDISFPSGYPNQPPLVHYHSGGLRLNPNLYDCGKVCLSLLNTWNGSKNEKWIPGMSTMLQVLVSIQALILNTDPYFNEPGYASSKGKPAGETNSKKYNESTFILSLRTMVYTMKKPPKHFEDYVIGHFRNRAHDILSSCKAYMDGAQVGSLVKGQVQSGKDKQGCSRGFKDSVAGFLPTLVTELTKIGAKDCEKFLPSATGVNKKTRRKKIDSA